jgi:hypothetical protein
MKKQIGICTAGDLTGMKIQAMFVPFVLEYLEFT